MDAGFNHWPGLRIAVLAGAVAETFLWAGIWLCTARTANPLGDGLEWMLPILATMVFVPLTLPALVLGVIGRWLVFGALLEAAVAAAYLYAWATSG
jgi:hypothetical protein